MGNQRYRGFEESAQNPLLVSFKDDFTAMLERVQSGALDDLPFSISNGDMNPTNLMVTEQGVVSGLVDWEMMDIWPLGFDLGAIHWIMGSGFGEKYSLYENADEIEKRFWVAFMSSVDEQEDALHLKTTFFWHFYSQTPFTSAPQAPQHSDKLIRHDLNPLSPFRNMHNSPYYPTVSAPVCPPILSDCINYCYFTMI